MTRSEKNKMPTPPQTIVLKRPPFRNAALNEHTPPSQDGVERPEMDKSNLETMFLNHLRRYKIPTTVFLTSGVKLQGIITDHDLVTVALRRESSLQLVYKNAISTVMPNVSVIGLEIKIDDEPETNPA